MTSDVLVLVTAASLIAGVVCWALFTVPYIRSFGQRANLSYFTLIVMPVVHVFWAIALGITNRREIPIGVFAHAGLLIVAVTGAGLYLVR